MTRKRSLYRTILALAVAALLAASLPFTVLYVEALTNHAVVAWKTGHAIVTTRASGQTTVSTGGVKRAPHTIVVRTHTS